MQIKRHIFSELVNELRDIPNVQSKRELIVRALGRVGIFPEPVGHRKRVLVRVIEVDKDGFAHLDAESAILRAYCHFPAVGPGWYYDGSFISPDQFAALDPETYHVKEPRDAGTGLSKEVPDAPTAG